MQRDRAALWSGFAFLVGVAIVAIHLAVRLSSGFGWMAVIQIVYVVWWLSLLLLPLAFHLSRREAPSDRPTRWLLLAASVLVLMSAITPDFDDYQTCFLGTCGKQAWWADSTSWLDSLVFVSLAESAAACLLLVWVMIRCAAIRQRARRAADLAPSGLGA